MTDRDVGALRRPDRQQEESARLPRLPPRVASAISLLLPLAALVVVQSVSPAAQRLPVGAARFDLAASWLPTEPGALVGASWLRDPALLGRLQLGALLRLAQAVQGGTVLGAAQSALLAVAVVQAVLLWLLLRRLGCGTTDAALATAAFAIAPAAIVAHTGVSTAGIAGVWLLAAALLWLREDRARVGAGAAAVLAVAASPLALPVAAVGAALVWRRPGRLAIAAGGGVAAVVLVAAAVVLSALPSTAAARALDGVAAAQPPAAPGLSALAAWAVADPLGLVIALVALVLTGRDARTRMPAVAAALLAAASIWPAGDGAAGPLVLLLTVAAVATGLLAERAAVALGDPVFRRSLIGSGWLTAVAALLLVGVVVCLTGVTALMPGADRPVALAGEWLRSSVPAGRVVLVGLGTWPDLGGGSRGSVGWYAGRSGGAAPSSAAWPKADYVIADASLQGAVGAAGAALVGSVAVARFGSGPDALIVRALRGGSPAPTGSPAPAPSASPSPRGTPSASAPTATPSASAPTATPSASAPTATPPANAAQRRALDARIRTGEQLSANPRIELTAGDRALLTSGQVDARIALVLAQFATTHRITVASFGVQPGDRSGIRTTVLISQVDGRRVPADLQRTGDLLRFLSALRNEFAARGIDATQQGVIASFIPDPEWVPAS